MAEIKRDWVLLADGEAASASASASATTTTTTTTGGSLVQGAELELLRLPHPKDGVPALFVLANDGLFELQLAQAAKFGSWFINDSIQGDSNLLLATRYDARFFYLPHLVKSAGRFCPLDQIVVDDPNCDRLPLLPATLPEICDVNTSLGEDMPLFRLNRDKTQRWLVKKALTAAAVLAEKREARIRREMRLTACRVNLSFQSSAPVSAPTSTASEAAATPVGPRIESEDKIVALQLLRDNFDDAELFAKVADELGVSIDELEIKSQPAKRKSDWEIDLENEKATKTFHNTSSGSSSSASSAISNHAASNTNAKSVPKKPATAKIDSKPPAKGVQSITSFFSAKKK